MTIIRIYRIAFVLCGTGILSWIFRDLASGYTPEILVFLTEFLLSMVFFLLNLLSDTSVLQIHRFFIRIEARKLLFYAALFSTIIYSTSVFSAYGIPWKKGAHWTLASEEGLSLSFYDRVEEKDFLQIGALEWKDMAKDPSGKFANLGILEKTIWRPWQRWKLAGIHGDSAMYLIQTHDILKSIAPYKYRWFPSFSVSILEKFLRIPTPSVFIVFNFICVLLTAFVVLFCLKTLGFSENMGIIGSILVITTTPIILTLPLPTLDPASYLFSGMIFYAVFTQNPLLFVIASILGVSSKEVLVFAAALWFMNTKQGWKNLLIAAVPVLAYMIIRKILGGAALEVNYGFNLAKFEIPKYATLRMNEPDWIPNTISLIFGALGMLWLGLFNLRYFEWNSFFVKNTLFILFVLTSTFFFSSATTRVLGIVYPAVIPLFLMFFENPFERNEYALL